MAASSYILVLDAGSSGPRCCLFNDSGEVVGSANGTWAYLQEQDVPSLARAFDPRQVWGQFCALIGECLSNTRVSPAQIAAVSATSQRQAVVFLDASGCVLYAGPNIDLRAVFEGAAIDDEFRDVVYRTTGRLPSFFFTLAKLRWFQLHRPAVYAKIATVLTLADWLVWRLTGDLSSEMTLACEAGLLDIRERELPNGLIEKLGLECPAAPLVESGTLAGKITERAASETGLREGTPVAIVGADTQCGLLGLGAAQERELGIVAGWSAPLQMVTARPVLPPGAKTWIGCFLIRDRWVLESSPGDIGNSYAWLADTLFGDDEDAFSKMDALASSVPVGSEGVTAFLGHSRMDMTALGMKPGGFIFPTPLTFSDTGRPHLVKASLEAMACAIRANLEQIEELAGVQAASIALGGGMTRTAAFTRILADVIGRELRLSPTPSVSALGAYLCARTALRDFASLDEAAQSVKSSLTSLEPDPLASADYQDHYEQWLELSAQVGGLTS
ncbi:MAG: FGGY-family carbohydrate kinase [Chloroflexi bacterium]|nr:FGGY-family carbohydrate kinase [Chloroflexota bacterium]